MATATNCCLLTNAQKYLIREAVFAALEEFGKDAEIKYKLPNKFLRTPIKEQSGNISEFIIRYADKYVNENTLKNNITPSNTNHVTTNNVMQQLLMDDDD